MFGFTVDFIGRDVDELLHSDFYCGFQHNVCASNIRFGESEGVAETEVDVGLSCEV